MKRFNEQDVRRHYDLLQHRPEVGLTQLKAIDRDEIIGIGLFDNEDDFVSECLRYNELGRLYVGVNPRSVQLLEDYGGLKNRMRTLFLDVVEDGGIDFVTGMAVPGPEGLSADARVYERDVSILYDRELFFPLDKAIPVERAEYADVAQRFARWLYGQGASEPVPLMQFVRVIGTWEPGGGWLKPRTRFRKYRPYILEGISGSIQEQAPGPETAGEGRVL